VLWIAPIFRPPAAEFKGSQVPRIQDLKGRLLRDEGRSGTVERVGAAVPVGEEPDLAVAEVEDRRVREAAIGVPSELVTSAVDVELLPLNLAFGVGQDHASRSERTETELYGVHHLKGPANRAAAVTETELGRNDEDVEVLLLVAELLEQRPGEQKPSVDSASPSGANPWLHYLEFTVGRAPAESNAPWAIAFHHCAPPPSRLGFRH